MEFDLQSLDSSVVYRLLASVVVPRPIAWVTSLSTAGVVNVAPFSFFNLLGTDPGVVALSIGSKGNGEPKDTRRNIEDTRGFVVNLVTYAARHEMNRTAAEFGDGEGEADIVGLALKPSACVKPPRLAVSPVNLECELAETVNIGDNWIVLGVVRHLHIDDAFYDAGRGYVATEKMDLIGRTHGRGGYVRLTDLFEMHRLKPDEARGPR